MQIRITKNHPLSNWKWSATQKWYITPNNWNWEQNGPRQAMGYTKEEAIENFKLAYKTWKESVQYAEITELDIDEIVNPIKAP